jgi:hypothetical protein
MDQCFSCNGCSAADPTQDTVKVDPNLILHRGTDKENHQPAPQQQAEEQTSSQHKFAIGQLVLVLRSNGEWSQGVVSDCSPSELTAVLEEGGQKTIPSDKLHLYVKPVSDELRKQAEADVRRRREQKVAAEQERLRQEAQVAAEEKAPLEVLVKAWQDEEAATAGAALGGQIDSSLLHSRSEVLESARQGEESAAAESAAAPAAAAAVAAAEEREAAEHAAQLAVAQHQVSKWCNQHGFKDATHPKKTLRGATKFPLHTAVKHRDAAMVDLLLKCGVDLSVLDSRHQTPGALAAKLNRNGSHERILALLVH